MVVEEKQGLVEQTVALGEGRASRRVAHILALRGILQNRFNKHTFAFPELGPDVLLTDYQLWLIHILCLL